MAELMILGGAEEIGANSCYIELDGTGILIDAGLHPRDRGRNAFPDIDKLFGRPTDVLVVTHAHTDHLGGVPFVLRRMPHLRTIMTRATRDLSHIMLHNNARLLKSDIVNHVPEDALAFYKREEIELLRKSFESLDYDESLDVRGYTGRSSVDVALHWSGHILGSAGISLENNGLRIIHTGDVMFEDQRFVAKARLPRNHADIVITEATNGADEQEVNYAAETRRLAEFVNRISGNNGSVLIPCFALGKTQEILTIIHALMRRGSIPNLPVYAGGMAVSVNKVYDQYCYQEPVKIPGFEISDIPFTRLTHDALAKGDFMKTPSIVVAASGMMSKDTMSFKLALKWLPQRRFGIAFVGYQDPSSPGSQLLHSPDNEPFDLAGRLVKRRCEIERLRFSAHASRSSIVDYISDVRPSSVVIIHGEPNACDALGLAIRERLPGIRILVPRKGVPYRIGEGAALTASSLDDEGLRN